MKKLLIVLLIVAAGAGVFYALQKNKITPTDSISLHEKLIGKWKMDTLTFSNNSANQSVLSLIALMDTNLLNYDYDFRKDGLILLTLQDSLLHETGRYEWKEKDSIILRDSPNDSTAEIFSCKALGNDTIVFRSADQGELTFRRVK